MLKPDATAAHFLYVADQHKLLPSALQREGYLKMKMKLWKNSTGNKTLTTKHGL